MPGRDMGGLSRHMAGPALLEQRCGHQGIKTSALVCLLPSSCTHLTDNPRHHMQAQTRCVQPRFMRGIYRARRT